jgi:hypothetical protein
MSKALCLELVWVLAMLAMPTTALANDGVFGGSGASLAPLESTPIRMVNEDIVLDLRGRPLAWNVTAIYEFENPTDAAVTVQMGFPEARCNPEEGDCYGQGGRFRGLRTRVRDVPVRHRIGRVTSESPWAMELSRVHLFNVTFAPRERVRIEHRYTYDRSFTAVLGENVHYLTRTGALFAGPIEVARFTVRTPNPPLLVEHPRTFRMLSWDRGMDGRRGVTELVFETRNWTPAEDFGLLLGDFVRIEAGAPVGDGSIDLSECPHGMDGLGPGGREFFEEAIRASPRELLEACRTFVFALSGHTFRDARFTRAFFGGPSRDSGMGEDWVVELLRPATSFTMAQMPASHGAYVRSIDAALAREVETTAE